MSSEVGGRVYNKILSKYVAPEMFAATHGPCVHFEVDVTVVEADVAVVEKGEAGVSLEPYARL